MRLLILGEPIAGDESPPFLKSYRGTFRSEPCYPEGFAKSVGDEHPTVKLFDWWFDESAHDQEANGLIRSLDKAKELVRTYAQYNLQELEIIEITLNDEVSVLGGEFLGFDLSLGFGDSLLYMTGGLALCHDYTGWHDPREAQILHQLHPLMCLLEEHFKPLLNTQGLLPDYQIARQCWNCINAIEQFVPDVFDWGGPHKWEIIGLYRIAVLSQEDSFAPCF
jgi:hypothetical protein